MSFYTPIEISLFGQHCERAADGDRDFSRSGNRHWVLGPSETTVMDRMPTVVSPHMTLTDLVFDAGHRPRLSQESGALSLTRLEDVCLETNFQLLFTRDRLFPETTTKLDHTSSLDDVAWASTDTMFPFTDSIMVGQEQDNVSGASHRSFLIDSGLFDRAKIVDTPCILLTNHGYNVYYHWLLEAVGRTWFLDAFPELRRFKLLVPQTLNAFNLPSLVHYGVDGSSVAGLSNGLYRFRTLFVPSFLASRADAGPRTIAHLQGRRAAAPPPDESRPRRFYISRTDAITRKVGNETAILEALAPLGVVPVSLGGMAFAEQVALFRDAELIVAPHGGGLANIVYCGPETVVVELSQRRWHPCFWYLTNLARLRHYMVTARTEWQREARHPYIFRTGTNPLRMEFVVAEVVEAVRRGLDERR